MNITFRNHPAQARHPHTKQPLFTETGEPVPLFPDQRGIYLDGYLIGYCSAVPDQPVCLIVHLPVEQLDIIGAKVSETFGQPDSVNMPPLMPENPLEEDDE